MSGDERASELIEVDDLGLDADEAERLLSAGDLELLGLMPRASNSTFLARVRSPSPVDPDVIAIYKPRRGERPLWDFPPGSLAGREVAAYRVARRLGWPGIPPTVLRDGPEGEGAVQLFRAVDPAEHAFSLLSAHPDAFRRIVAFDLVVNNADRKAGHTLQAPDGEIVVIDHGVCFHVEPKLRTVLWAFEGEPITEPIADDLEVLLGRLTPAGALRAELADVLEPTEIDALARRIQTLLASGRFPAPDETTGPPYPWPPI